MNPVEIVRPFEPADRQPLEALWGEVFADDPPWNRPAVMIDNKLKVQPELLLVSTIDGELAGAVMAGFDACAGGFITWPWHQSGAGKVSRHVSCAPPSPGCKDSAVRR